MSVASWKNFDGWANTEVKGVVAELERFDLMRNVAELEIYGFTVVDAAKTGLSETAKRAHDVAMDLHEKRTGIRPDVKSGSTHRKTSAPALWNFVHENPVFEELMINPVGLALVRYLVGRRAMLSESAMFMKGPHGTHDAALSLQSNKLQLGLHCDYILRPEPFPPYAEECNLTFLLTDYTIENGAISFIPGSHKHRRYPRAGDQVDDQIVAVEAPRGSLVLINDGVWHGSLPSTHEGLRVGMALRYCRPHIFRRERFNELPAGYLESRPAIVQELMRGYEFTVQDHGAKDIEAFGKFPRYMSVFS